MSQLFSVLFVITVFCYGADRSVNDIVPLSEAVPATLPVALPTLPIAIPGLPILETVEQATGINVPNLDLIKKGSCAIYLDASTATDEEKEAAYQAIEGAISNFEGKVPDSISINVGISNLELVDAAAENFAEATNQESEEDRVIAVKDIKILEVVIDIDCDQATQEEKNEFFKAVSTVLVGLCSQLQEVANGIHGSITFDSPDLNTATKSSEVIDEIATVGALPQVCEEEKGLLDGVVGTVIGTVVPVANQVPVAGPAVTSVVATVVAPIVNQVGALEPIVDQIPVVGTIL